VSNLAQILEQSRALYVDAFVQRFAGYPDDVAGSMRPEALYVDSDGKPLRTGELNLPARGDLCVLTEGRVQEIARIESARSITFEPFRFVWADSLQVAMRPFHWNDCTLLIPEPVQGIDLQPLTGWAENAIDVAQSHAPNGNGLGVVHSAVFHDKGPEGGRLELDLGTAPVDTFGELLGAMVAANVSLIALGNL